jgi:hypothetical protein
MSLPGLGQLVLGADLNANCYLRWRQMMDDRETLAELVLLFLLLITSAGRFSPRGILVPHEYG